MSHRASKSVNRCDLRARGTKQKKEVSERYGTAQFTYMCRATPIGRQLGKLKKLVELGNVINFEKFHFDRSVGLCCTVAPGVSIWPLHDIIGKKTFQLTASCKDLTILQATWSFKTAKIFDGVAMYTVMKC